MLDYNGHRQLKLHSGAEVSRSKSVPAITSCCLISSYFTFMLSLDSIVGISSPLLALFDYYRLKSL